MTRETREVDTAIYDGRATAGARYLDERYPGWTGIIDVEQLDVRSGFLCPLAQAAEQTFDELDVARRMTIEDLIGFGFTVIDPRDAPPLNYAWRKVIAHRRGEPTD